MSASWRRFSCRALLIALVVGALYAYALDRYRIGIDTQASTCLQYRVYLIDRWDTTPERGRYMAFRSQGLAPTIADGVLVIKQVIGLPGDVVIRHYHHITVNGQVYHAPQQPDSLQAFALSDAHALSASQLWMYASADNSFDSRYWGPLSHTQLVGHAYPLW